MPTTATARKTPAALRSSAWPRCGGACRAMVAASRGIGWLIAVVLVPVALGGLLDWRFHLPPLVQGLLLVGTLVAAGVVAIRFLIRPVSGPTDDLTLAVPAFEEQLRLQRRSRQHRAVSGSERRIVR